MPCKPCLCHLTPGNDARSCSVCIGNWKSGNSLLGYLWTEATMHAVEKDEELKRFYRRKLVPKRNGKSKDRSGSQTGNSAVDHDARSD